MSVALPAHTHHVSPLGEVNTPLRAAQRTSLEEPKGSYLYIGLLVLVAFNLVLLLVHAPSFLRLLDVPLIMHVLIMFDSKKG